MLKDLIEHFSQLPLGNKNVTSDLVGDAYEYLIKKFADATNKKAGEFYTPRSVVRLMIEMLDPKETDTIYDPACGIPTDINGSAVSLRSAWDQWQTDGRAFWQQMDGLVETLDGFKN